MLAPRAPSLKILLPLAGTLLIASIRAGTLRVLLVVDLLLFLIFLCCFCDHCSFVSLQSLEARVYLAGSLARSAFMFLPLIVEPPAFLTALPDSPVSCADVGALVAALQYWFQQRGGLHGLL